MSCDIWNSLFLFLSSLNWLHIDHNNNNPSNGSHSICIDRGCSWLITSVPPSPATLPSSNQPFLQPRPSCSLTDRTPTFLSNSTLHSKMALALVSLCTSSSLALVSAASSGISHESFCAFRCGSPACCDQPPVFPGQRGRCVRVGGWLHLDELQTAGHDRRGGHGSTSRGEWVD